MDWNEFFERTRVAADVESFSKLAPLLGITDGAIGHYRQGRRVPQVWVVADALRIQGHPEPEKAAIEIMKRAALTSPERAFWKRLAATATLLAVGVLGSAPVPAQAAGAAFKDGSDSALCEMLYWGRILRDWLAHKLHRPKPSPTNLEAFAAWI